MKKEWKRVIPPRVLNAYRKTRLGAYLVRNLKTASVASLMDSLRFSSIVFRVKDSSLLAPHHLESLHDLARALDAEGVKGDFVECGVYRGGSAALLGAELRRSLVKRHLWLFDSFQGMPMPANIDGPCAKDLQGDFVGDAANVRRLLKKVGAPLDRVHIIPGWFSDTLSGASIDRVALLHIDADFYESVKLCLERLYDALVPSGIVVLDDYDYWPGCRAALEDFRRARSLQIELSRHHDAPPFFRKPA